MSSLPAVAPNDAILFAGAIGAPVFAVADALIVLIIKGWGE